MKKIIQKEIEEYTCDNCRKVLEFVPYTLGCSFGSNLDGHDFHFCSNKCLRRFIDEKTI